MSANGEMTSDDGGGEDRRVVSGCAALAPLTFRF